ncbi:MAG: DUF455 family protein [Phycisphaerales bacterium]|nr:DUF455 family protein [Phycisphaerales bacterium]
MTTANPVKMKARDTRAALMVPDSAAILKRFYFLLRELVLMQAGWMPGTAHWGSKLLLPEVLWQDQQTVQALRQRVLELRYPEREIDLSPDERLVACWKHLIEAPQPQAFVEALAKVVKPLLRQVFTEYLQRADALDDGPTVRILKIALTDIDEQLGRWNDAIADARNVYPELIAGTDRWLDGLESTWLSAIGDLLDPRSSVDERAYDPRKFGGKPFAISRLGQRDRRFRLVRFGWPDALDPAFGAGEGMQLQIRQAVHHINEVWAAEMAAACIYDLGADADAEFLTDAARWCYDEIRHCRMGYTRLDEWGFKVSEMPLGSFSYDAGANADAITRLGIIFYFESTYIHTKSKRMHYFSEFGDRTSSHDMDFDWADEQIHAHYGAHWLKYFLEKTGDPRKPIDFRDQSEACVTAIRATATEKDKKEVMETFEQTMARARELIGA